MYSLKILTKKEIKDFTAKKKTNFMQTYEWGQANIKRKKIPHYLGLINNDKKIIASAMLLETKLTKKYSYFYSPRGFIIDYKDIDLLKNFTSLIKEYIKKRNGIFLTIDPDIKLRDIDENGEEINNQNNNYDIVENLKKVNFKHLGFNKNFENNQPRYTFKIDFTKTWEEIEKNISKSFVKNVKKANKYQVEIKKGTKKDLKTFYNLQLTTGNRDNFIPYSYEIFEAVYDNLNPNGMCDIFLSYIYPQKIIKSLNKELKEKLETKKISSNPNKLKDIEKSILRINKELNLFKKYNQEEIILGAHLVVYHINKAWALYAGSKDILTETFANNKLYCEKLKNAKKRNIESFDLFGTTGNPTKDNHLIGIHNFKKQFGGTYIEYIGEFDLIINKVLYYFYKHTIPGLRKIKKFIKKIKH